MSILSITYFLWDISGNMISFGEKVRQDFNLTRSQSDQTLYSSSNIRLTQLKKSIVENFESMPGCLKRFQQIANLIIGILILAAMSNKLDIVFSFCCKEIYGRLAPMAEQSLNNWPVEGPLYA